MEESHSTTEVNETLGDEKDEVQLITDVSGDTETNTDIHGR
jgi:hypothetical protein